MAPRTRAFDKTADEAKDVSTFKTSVDKVVKRPRRGYHKFRNGLLNVTPKGDEKELTESNRLSPLLRLPAEIRNEIWKYALGGKVYRGVFDDSKAPSTKLSLPRTEPANTAALLRTCRQIYAETALMLCSLNKFSFDFTADVCVGVRKLKSIQRRQIMSVQLELLCPAGDPARLCKMLGARHMYMPSKSFVNRLPCLKKICVSVFGAEVGVIGEEEIEEIKSLVQKQLERGQDMEVLELGVKVAKRKWEAYNTQ
ncbi:hypothetical protein N0V83_004172 [Neocucurbitaria cava]|uniref:2EXR domain-containing protein n=1 Tax=Neocucurbitaria cava TaxID=798079 RepID=A0A9W9CNU1_9PLEO|nr:hypothetical protein N0V83_004172 [Neocucurbitaria cava]